MIRDLFQGLSGEDVRNMQGMLNLHLAQKISPPLEADGKFGAKTDVRVRYFQRINGLYIDGIVGPHTRAAILDFRQMKTTVAGTPVTSAVLPQTSAAGTSTSPQQVGMFQPNPTPSAFDHSFSVASTRTQTAFE